jgi:mannose-6-phosphate isomerase-like protein (cupin superfamily)
MDIARRNKISGRSFPAGRTSVNIVGGLSPVAAQGFALGHVVLDPDGGQVPWHNHPQEEIYYLLSGNGEMCVGSERCDISAGDVVHIPSHAYHQLTNTGSEPLEFIYCYSPAGPVDHWRQELEGTLPAAGIDAPALPEGACRQHLRSLDQDGDA